MQVLAFGKTHGVTFNIFLFWFFCFFNVIIVIIIIIPLMLAEVLAALCFEGFLFGTGICTKWICYLQRYWIWNNRFCSLSCRRESHILSKSWKYYTVKFIWTGTLIILMNWTCLHVTKLSLSVAFLKCFSWGGWISTLTAPSHFFQMIPARQKSRKYQIGFIFWDLSAEQWWKLMFRKSPKHCCGTWQCNTSMTQTLFSPGASSDERD